MKNKFKDIYILNIPMKKKTMMFSFSICICMVIFQASHDFPSQTPSEEKKSCSTKIINFFNLRILSQIYYEMYLAKIIYITIDDTEH